MNKEITAQTAFSCAKCGACVPVCPQYQVQGRESFTARGKLHLLQKIPLQDAGAGFAGILSSCLLCGACSSVCPRDLDIPSLVSRARAGLTAELNSTPLAADLARAGMRNKTVGRLLGSAAKTLDRHLLRRLPMESGLRLKFSLPDTDFSPDSGAGRRPLPSESSTQGADRPDAVHIFEGCFARYLQNGITEATAALVEDRLQLAAHSPQEQQCCGLAFRSAGQHRLALELAQKNIDAFSSSSGPVLVTCASCFSHLASYPSLFPDDPAWHRKASAFAARLQEFSSFFLDRQLTTHLGKTSKKAAVYYHDSCHLRFHRKITAPPRTLLQAIASLQLVEPARGYQCCGAGGLFQLHHPELADKIRTGLVSTISSLHASHVVTTCSGCLLHLHHGLKAARLPIEIDHLAVFLAQSLL